MKTLLLGLLVAISIVMILIGIISKIASLVLTGIGFIIIAFVFYNRKHKLIYL